MRSIVIFTVLVLLIGIVGRLDIVVSASGKFVPDARIKVIQPAMTGVVREILVHDGERVTAGQLLMKLDTTQAAADADKAQSSKLDAQLGAARANALLAALHDNRPPVVKHVEGATDDRMQEAQRLAEGAFLEYQDKVDSARAELLKREAELDSTRQEVAKLQATAPLARQQANEYKSLAGINMLRRLTISTRSRRHSVRSTNYPHNRVTRANWLRVLRSSVRRSNLPRRNSAETNLMNWKRTRSRSLKTGMTRPRRKPVRRC